MVETMTAKTSDLDKSTPDVNEVHGRLNPTEIGSSAGAEEHHPRQVSTQYPDEVKKGRQ